MRLTRRAFMVATGSAITLPRQAARAAQQEDTGMYGLIGRILAKSGERDALIAILLDGTRDMPGCLSYVVAYDTGNADAIWVTEIWESESHHRASLSLPSVQQAIARGKPLIAGFGDRIVTAPVGGHGLTPRSSA